MIYSFRREVLESESLKDRIFEMIETEVDELLSVYCPDAGEWDLNGLRDAVYGLFSVDVQLEESSLNEMGNLIALKAKEAYENKEREAGPEFMRYIEKMVLLQVIDAQWKDHLLGIDHIKEGIGLRGYAQRDPLVEYKKEAFELFADMSRRINTEVLMRLFKIQVRQETLEQQSSRAAEQQSKRLVYNRGDGDSAKQPVHKEKKIGRNDPCPCGSGKKYKKCCGMN